MKRELREIEATKFRAAYHEQEPVEPEDSARWLRREIIVQRAVVLCDIAEEGTPVIGPVWRRFHVDAEHHAWVTVEARIAAELALAKILGQPVADMDSVTFLQWRSQILNTPEKRARFETDEEYEFAVFIMTMAAMRDCRDGRLGEQAKKLFAVLPMRVPMAEEAEEPGRAD